MPLTARQQRFVDAYDGNATAAARIAGYKGTDKTLGAVGHENLKKPYIAAAIQARETKRSKPHILSREERQTFWSDVVSNAMLGLADRLRASELLGKSEADFTDKLRHEGAVSIAVVDPYAVSK